MIEFSFTSQDENGTAISIKKEIVVPRKYYIEEYFGDGIKLKAYFEDSVKRTNK